jgi:ribosome-binding factor A
MVRGTEISPEHSKFFEESEGVWTSRDHKLQKRVERLQRKKQLREKFAYANTANRNDGGADLSIPLDNDSFYSRPGRNARLDSSWADSVRQLRVGGELQRALAQVIESDYKDYAPDADLFRSQLAFEAVRMTRDTRIARVYFSTVIDTPEMRKLVYKALLNASTAIRTLLVRRVNLKYAPQLIFMKDEFNREQRLTELALARIEELQAANQKRMETVDYVDDVGVDGVDGQERS